MRIARDKGNKLWLYWCFKPIRDDKHGRWVQEFQSTIKQLGKGKFFMLIDEQFFTDDFKYLKWEDDPIEVELIKTK